MSRKRRRNATVRARSTWTLLAIGLLWLGTGLVPARAQIGFPVAASPAADAASMRCKGPGSPPAFDMEALETRLRNTDAIGVFTKLALKNQVGDLLKDFRGYHARESDLTLEELRERFNLLLLKVMTLLQDDDPDLAGYIARAKPGLWGVLVDPEKLATI